MYADKSTRPAIWLVMGIVFVAMAYGAYHVWDDYHAYQTFTANDAASIARYKNWINLNERKMVGGRIESGDLPRAYRQVIEYDVQAGDLKSARGFINQAIKIQLGDQVMALVQVPEARELIGHVQNAQRKTALLNQFVAEMEEPGDTERTRLAREFCQVPFDAKACPEAAAEIAETYQSKLVPLKDKDKIVQQVAREVETKCLAPAPEASK